jgi:hypothetical protein
LVENLCRNFLANNFAKNRFFGHGLAYQAW